MKIKLLRSYRFLVAQADKRVAFYNGKHSVILEIPEGVSIRNVVNAELLEVTQPDLDNVN